MPAPRKPKFVAEIDGAKNKRRFAGRNEPSLTDGVGDCPPYLAGKARDSWNTYRIEMPWLRQSDRSNLELAATIRADLMDGQQVGIQRAQLLRQLNNSFGGSPSDISKVAMPEEDNDPNDAFFE